MAVQVFKNGVVSYVEPSRLQSHLATGWTLEPGGSPTLEIVDPIIAENEMLEKMGILPTLKNVVIGATRIRV